MHELSLAEDILALVERHARGLSVVTSITLSIGELAGVEVDALRFCLTSVLKDSKAEAARILIDTVPARARCPRCGKEQALAARYEPCADCGAFGLELLSGDALRVAALTGRP